MDRKKPCSKCGEVKSLDDFHKNLRMADGHLNKCKECKRQDNKLYYQANREVCLARFKEWNKRNYEKAAAYRRTQQQLAEYRAGCVRRDLVRRKKDKTKTSAREAVHYAVRIGSLVRGPCEVCGSTENIHAHHDDYLKPLEVRWLCHEHHREAHGQTTLERKRISK